MTLAQTLTLAQSTKKKKYIIKQNHCCVCAQNDAKHILPRKTSFLPCFIILCHLQEGHCFKTKSLSMYVNFSDLLRDKWVYRCTFVVHMFLSYIFNQVCCSAMRNGVICQEWKKLAEAEIILSFGSFQVVLCKYES